MPLHDIHSDITVAHGAVATLSGTTPAASNIVDMQGYEGLVWAVTAGAVTDAGTTAGFTIKMQESDTTAAADFTDVAAADTTGDLVVTDDGADNAPIGRIGYMGDKRYVRLVMTGTTNTNAVVAAVAIKGRPSYGPAVAVAANVAAT